MLYVCVYVYLPEDLHLSGTRSDLQHICRMVMAILDGSENIFIVAVCHNRGERNVASLLSGYV